MAALREHLRWFDARPLFGKRVLVTRPREQAAELVERLEAMGAEAIEAPMIRIAPPDDYGPLDEACARAGTFDWIVFSSANAVDVFMARLLKGPGDVRALAGVTLCAVGSGDRRTAGAARPQGGPDAGRVPGRSRSPPCAGALEATSVDVRGRKVLLPHADIGRELVAEELRKHGADVTEVIAYRTMMTEPEREGGPDIYRMLLERRIDVVTFTSASAVRNFVKVLGAEPAADLLKADTLRRLHRSRHGRGRGAVPHQDDHPADRIHYSRARRRDCPAFRRRCPS